MLADPEFVTKSLAGRLDDVVPCIDCGECIVAILAEDKGVECSVNAALGKEKEYRLEPAEKSKRVLVVGAALRGHEVTLWEKNNELGGQLLQAAIPLGKELIRNLTAYLSSQLGKSGVKVECGKEASAKTILGTEPEVVVLATGSVPFIPEIPGIDRSNVVTAIDVLTGKAETGEKVVIIGGARVGCETADFLANRGKKVTIPRRGPEMLTTMKLRYRANLLAKLSTQGVTMLPGVKYREITDQGVVITSSGGVDQLIEADTIVIAAGAKPNTTLLNAVKGKSPEVYSVGDCVQPRRILDAIHEGARIGANDLTGCRSLPFLFLAECGRYVSVGG